MGDDEEKKKNQAELFFLLVSVGLRMPPTISKKEIWSERETALGEKKKKQ